MKRLAVVTALVAMTLATSAFVQQYDLVTNGGQVMDPETVHDDIANVGVKMATSDNAELLALSGPRNPYQAGPLGVVKKGAYANLILVKGNPLENLDLVADPGKNFAVIMRDGKIYKNTIN